MDLLSATTDNLPDLTPMPLLAALTHGYAANRLSFHMPGHRSGASWPQAVRSLLASLDTTELPVTDDLHHPTGPARLAMDAAARYFGSGQTYFLTNGSTAGLLTLLAACVGRRGRLLLSRTCHQAVLHAVALLEIEPVWLACSPALPSPFGMLPMTTVQALHQALNGQRPVQAVLVTSPDYYGHCADLAGLAAVTHAAGALLLVDEAHGAHLVGSVADLPPPALAAGADACVQSAHKTLPALTQGAYLHVSAAAMRERRVDCDRIAAMLRVFQTSSPSLAIAASLDFARYYLQSQGQACIQRLLAQIDRLGEQLPSSVLVSPTKPVARADQASQPGYILRDPLRLVISLASTGRSALEASAWLSARGVDVEMADLTRLVLIPALDQPSSDFARLARLLTAFLTETAGPLRPGSHPDHDLEQTWLSRWCEPVDLAIHPGELLFGRRATRVVELSAAAGHVAAQAITPYPPGVPLIWPGEVISAGQVDLLRQLSENNVNLIGLAAGHVKILPGQ